jgi:hypothetical protein
MSQNRQLASSFDRTGRGHSEELWRVPAVAKYREVGTFLLLTTPGLI